MSALVGELMDPRVESCEFDETLAEIECALSRTGTRVIPVVRSFRNMILIAEVTRRAVEDAIAELDDAAYELSASDLVEEPVWCGVSDSADAALSIMVQHERLELPVVEGGQRLVGLLSVDRAYSHSDRFARREYGRQALRLTVSGPCALLSRGPRA